jgi:hypothetical protein
MYGARENKMRAIEGEMLRNKFTNELHQVMRIGNSRVIVENENGSLCISLRKEDLGSYYETVEGGDA